MDELHADSVHVWHVDFKHPLYPRLELNSTKDFLEFFHKQGGIAYHGEEYTSFGFDGPKTWITAQLLWDTGLDVDALLRQALFCDLLQGIENHLFNLRQLVRVSPLQAGGNVGVAIVVVISGPRREIAAQS